MALSKQKKAEQIDEVNALLATSKLTVMAEYRGTSVKALQSLRALGKSRDTTLKVYKNRLVKMALSNNELYKDLDQTALTGQLLYAFSAEDEVAPASVIADFAKDNPQMIFVGGFDNTARWLTAEEVKALAKLPSKDQLRATLAGTLNSPLGGFMGVVSGVPRGFVQVLAARAQSI